MKQPFWAALIIIAIEALVVLVLIPGNWTAKVIEEESQLLEIRLGPEEHRWVHDKARRWFNSSLIETGYYEIVRNHLIPTEEQKRKSVGMQKMGASWFDWAESRLQALANSYYHILTRFALLQTWMPYFLILLIPAVFDGITTWKIKRTNFAYASPLLHQYSTYGIVYIAMFLVALFIAPVILDPVIIPAAIMIACVMAGLMIGNFQKRV